MKKLLLSAASLALLAGCDQAGMTGGTDEARAPGELGDAAVCVRVPVVRR